ncbi:alcohol dehydrogenase catalytic domain-containing protein [Sinorhizobium fredii]|uniref:alcohol dehydrogenase catalytic domain-containing protein n=1 Tax=Rhizobium fredii TaxID=380 RepID=UPI00351232AA
MNPSDLIPVTGAYRARTELPFVPGFEGVGVVRRVGTGVHHLKSGDRVVPIGASGAVAAIPCPSRRMVLCRAGRCERWASGNELRQSFDGTAARRGAAWAFRFARTSQHWRDGGRLGNRRDADQAAGDGRCCTHGHPPQREEPPPPR